MTVGMVDPYSVARNLLAAVAIQRGADRSLALNEAQTCIHRHGTEEPTVESATQLVGEMVAWADSLPKPADDAT